MATDYSSLSDEELDAIIEGKVMAPALEASREKAAIEKANAPVLPKDKTMGMSGTDLALAGAKGEIEDVVQGLKEKGKIAFRPAGEEGKKVLSDIASARKARNEYNDILYSNPEANFGKFGVNALLAAAAPARLGPQMVLQGALEAAKAGTPYPAGLGAELINSALHGGVAAGTQGVLGAGLNAVGRSLGAATGKFTPEGIEALKTRASAERLGLPPTSIEQLYPMSPSGRIGRGLPGYEEKVSEQAKAMRNVLDRPLKTPEGDIPNVGQVYIDELSDAAKQRLALANEKYKAVDDYVSSNGLGNFTPQYAARAITNWNNPGYEVATDLLSRYGFDAASMKGVKASDLSKQPLSFENFHTMRTAANKALNTLDRGMVTAEKMGASIPAENRAAKKFLTDFKTALDNDAERWANKHASNKDALSLYKDATQYYRDVVAPTVLDNPVARKAMSAQRGYKTGEEGLKAATSSSGQPYVERLEPTMSELGRDITQVLRAMPDVRKMTINPDTRLADPAIGLGQLAKAASGHPLTALQMAIGRLPLARSLAESQAAAKLAGSENLLQGQQPRPGSVLQAMKEGALRDRLLPRQGIAPRAAYGALQFLQDDSDDKAHRLLGLR